MEMLEGVPTLQARLILYVPSHGIFIPLCLDSTISTRRKTSVCALRLEMNNGRFPYEGGGVGSPGIYQLWVEVHPVRKYLE